MLKWKDSNELEIHEYAQLMLSGISWECHSPPNIALSELFLRLIKIPGGIAASHTPPNDWRSLSGRKKNHKHIRITWTVYGRVVRSSGEIPKEWIFQIAEPYKLEIKITNAKSYWQPESENVEKSKRNVLSLPVVGAAAVTAAHTIRIVFLPIIIIPDYKFTRMCAHRHSGGHAKAASILISLRSRTKWTQSHVRRTIILIKTVNGKRAKG